jgi:hypothetical protein
MAPMRTRSKVALAALVVVTAAALTSGFWVTQIGRSLVCKESVAQSDAMLIENFDPNYLLFERAAALEQAKLAPLTLVPVAASRGVNVANPVSEAIAAVMARQARLRQWRTFPIVHTEPISLNAALQIRARLAAEGVRSVIVLAPGFRSRRSSLVYQATLGAAGVTVHCVPIFGRASPERWTHTWHGIQQVVEEFIKLQYYRFYVLPFVAPRAGS